MPRTPSIAPRGPYRGDYRQTLAGIERERRHAEVTVEELAERAGMTRAKIYRIRRTGLAFLRDVNALRMAIREIKKQRRQQRRLFAIEGDLAAIEREGKE